MEVPVGTKDAFPSPEEINEENIHYQLFKGIFGLCQSVRQFDRILSKVQNPSGLVLM